MKVLYLAPDAVPAPKGAGVRIERTVRTLVELGHEVELLTPAPGGASPPAALDGPGAVLRHDRVPVCGDGYLERSLALREAAERWLAGRHADIVFFRGIWEGAPALRFARRTGAHAVFEAHGFPSVELPGHFPALLHHPRTVEKLIAEESACLLAADLVVTPSETGRRFLLLRGVEPSRIALVRNTADPETFSPPAVPPADELPLRLVYTGTLAPWQGLGLLIEALAAHRAGGGVELHVVGTVRSAWRNELRALARRLRVHHMLHLSGPADPRNLVPVLRTAGACVAPLPSDPRNALQGCSPLKLFEYMAVGRPILTTRIPPVEELLGEDEAVLVRPSSPRALADGIGWLLAHPVEREERGARARAAFLARHAPREFVTSLAAAVSTAAAGASACGQGGRTRSRAV